MMRRIFEGDRQIVILSSSEVVHDKCKSGDVAVCEIPTGWRVLSVGDRMELDSFEGSFGTLGQAIKAAKI